MPKMVLGTVAYSSSLGIKPQEAIFSGWIATPDGATAIASLPPCC